VEVENKTNYEYRVGLFTVIALIILFWGWSWLKDFSFNPPQRFQVQFHDIAGLTKNAPVQVNGVRVGVVEKIDLKGEGQVVCSLRIPKENTVIPQGSKITIQTLGLVGAKYIEITLPKLKPDESIPPPIEPGSLVIGQDPVRSELYINRIAANLSEFTDSLAGLKAREGVAKAAEDSGAAIENLKIAAAKFSNNMDRLTDVTTDLKHGACSADGFFVEGKSTLQKISNMADEWRDTSHKINHIVGQPNFSADIKETVKLAKETVMKAQEAIHELNQTLADKDMRQDMISMLNKLTNSTENINQSMQVVKQLAGDQQLRSDLKEAMSNAKSAMSKANDLLSNPNFITDARVTMAQLRSAASQVREMAERINNLLSKKHPLLHMMFSAGLSKSAKELGLPEKGAIKSSSHTEYTEKTDGHILHESSNENTVIENKTDGMQPDSTAPIPVHGEIK
jgi:ABC-type transporter Mla subunit MlaD